ncbi:hypothetical protein [Mycobacterium sp.]|uniref:hypothetical protein n=1 Tax=Mycobacterium sp. TaxID=1785 RepID=UPI003A855F79
MQMDFEPRASDHGEFELFDDDLSDDDPCDDDPYFYDPDYDEYAEEGDEDDELPAEMFDGVEDAWGPYLKARDPVLELAEALLDGVDLANMSDDQVQAALLARIEEFDALPSGKRKARADRFAPAPPEAESHELPFLYVASPPEEVEAAAAAAPLAVKVQGLRDFLGPDGKTLTAKGNLKLADGRALVGLLDTGDDINPRIGNARWYAVSTAELPGLGLILDVAMAAGAVRVYKGRLVPVKAWTARSRAQQGAELFAAIIDLGPLRSRFSGRVWYLTELHRLLDEGIVYWLTPLLGLDAALPMDDIEGWALAVVEHSAPAVDHLSAQRWERLVRRNLRRLFDVLDTAGVVCWTDRVEVPEPYGPSSWTGGTVTITALGRQVLPDLLEEAGWALRRAEDIAGGDGAALLDAMARVPDSRLAALVAGWQPDRSTVERVKLIVEAIAVAGSADTRMTGFIALEQFDIEVVEPLVRELLDTPAAGYTALWLIALGRAGADTLGSFVDLGSIVDGLWALSVADPEQLCDFFVQYLDPPAVLEGMWRHRAPETAIVLDTLGRHLPDKAIAKAARKAAMRHRGWMANPRG